MRELEFQGHNGTMSTQSGLWLIRSKANEVMALMESDTFRTIYQYCEETWPDLLTSDSMLAMRIR